jgi:hypothetical protein
MEGGVVAAHVDTRVVDGRQARFANLSRHAITAAFVAVIALAFHISGASGSTATTNLSVLVLSTLIAQVSLPRRELRSLLLATSQRAHFENPRYDRRAVARPALPHMLSQTGRVHEGH